MQTWCTHTRAARAAASSASLVVTEFCRNARPEGPGTERPQPLPSLRGLLCRPLMRWLTCASSSPMPHFCSSGASLRVIASTGASSGRTERLLHSCANAAAAAAPSASRPLGLPERPTPSAGRARPRVGRLDGGAAAVAAAPPAGWPSAHASSARRFGWPAAAGSGGIGAAACCCCRRTTSAAARSRSSVEARAATAAASTSALTAPCTWRCFNSVRAAP